MNEIIQSQGLAYANQQQAPIAQPSYEQGQTAQLQGGTGYDPGAVGDAVKAGQGMGNAARTAIDEYKAKKTAAELEKSKSLTPAMKPNSGYEKPGQAAANAKFDSITSGGMAGMGLSAGNPTVAPATTPAQSGGAWSKFSGFFGGGSK